MGLRGVDQRDCIVFGNKNIFACAMINLSKEAVLGAINARPPKYLSFVVDAARVGADATGRIDRRVSAVVVEKPVLLAGTVYIKSDDRSFVIDGVGGCTDRLGEVDNGVGPRAVDEALFGATATLLEISSEFSLGIDGRDSCVDAS